MTDELIRDEDLGEALRALPVPEHRPGFWEEALPANESARRRPKFAKFAAAAVVLLLAGFAATQLRPDVRKDTGVVAGAPDVTKMVTGVLEGQQQSGDGLQTFNQTFALAVDGSSSLVLTDGKGSQSFDAVSRRSLTSSQEGSGQGIGWFVRENVEPQPVLLSSILGGLPATVADSEGEPTAFLGRDAHRFTQTGALRAFGVRGDADRIEVVSDDETGIMLFYEATLGGDVVARLEVLELDAADTIDRTKFSVEVPAGGRVIRTSDEGVRLMTLDELDDAVSYTVDAPASLEGFTLASVAVRPGMPGSQSGVANPLQRDRVQLLYRDGWQAIEVVIHRHQDTANPTSPTGPIAELVKRSGEFTVTVRGGFDTDRRNAVLDRMNPRSSSGDG